MKKVLISLLSLLLIVSLAACDLDQTEEKGRKVLEKDSQGREVKVSFEDDAGNVFRYETYAYDDQDRVIRTDYLDAQGNPTSAQALVYDSDGRIARETNYDAAGCLTDKTDITYYDSGKKKTTVMEEYRDAGKTLFRIYKTEFTEDEKGTHQWDYDANMVLQHEHIWDATRQYNKNVYYKEGTMTGYQEEYQEENGNWVWKDCDPDGSLRQESLSDAECKYLFGKSYDENGELLEATEYGKDGYTYAYSRYDQGRLIFTEWVNAVTDEDGTEREIIPKVVLTAFDGTTVTYETRTPEQTLDALDMVGEEIPQVVCQLLDASGDLLEEYRHRRDNGNLIREEKLLGEGNPYEIKQYDENGKLYYQLDWDNGMPSCITFFDENCSESLSFGDRSNPSLSWMRTYGSEDSFDDYLYFYERADGATEYLQLRKGQPVEGWVASSRGPTIAYTGYENGKQIFQVAVQGDTTVNQLLFFKTDAGFYHIREQGDHPRNILRYWLYNREGEELIRYELTHPDAEFLAFSYENGYFEVQECGTFWEPVCTQRYHVTSVGAGEESWSLMQATHYRTDGTVSHVLYYRADGKEQGFDLYSETGELTQSYRCGGEVEYIGTYFHPQTGRLTVNEYGERGTWLNAKEY